jgi:hypothetical protein
MNWVWAVLWTLSLPLLTAPYALVPALLGLSGRRQRPCPASPASLPAAIASKAQTNRWLSDKQEGSGSLEQALPVATLDRSTTWRMRLFIQGGFAQTVSGRIVTNDLLFVVNCRFVEEEGYEPPQGAVEVVPSSGGNDKLSFSKSYWKLSEDPNDRKDGLWVWGLFKEPLYPFMLLQIETNGMSLLDSQQGDSTDQDPSDNQIAPMQLYAQLNHGRDKERGVLLGESSKLAAMATFPLQMRIKETVRADPFGGATVDLYNERVVGTISIQRA